MDCDNRLFKGALDHHPNSADAPNIVGVPDINLLSDLDLINFLLQLPSDMVTLLRLPLDLDIRVLWVDYQLLNHIIYWKARKQHRAFRGPYRLVTNEACLLDDQVFIDAFGAERMTTYRSLAFVDEFKAQRTDQRLEVLIRINI